MQHTVHINQQFQYFQLSSKTIKLHISIHVQLPYHYRLFRICLNCGHGQSYYVYKVGEGFMDATHMLHENISWCRTYPDTVELCRLYLTVLLVP